MCALPGVPGVAGISPDPALNHTVCALRSFYAVTLGGAKIPEQIAYARTLRKLPAILSADEAVRFLEAGAFLEGAYGADDRLYRGTSCLGDRVPEGSPTSTASAW
nr:hypothetical protein [Sinorhizobium meliloti]